MVTSDTTVGEKRF